MVDESRESGIVNTTYLGERIISNILPKLDHNVILSVIPKQLLIAHSVKIRKRRIKICVNYGVTGHFAGHSAHKHMKDGNYERTAFYMICQKHCDVILCVKYHQGKTKHFAERALRSRLFFKHDCGTGWRVNRNRKKLSQHDKRRKLPSLLRLRLKLYRGQAGTIISLNPLHKYVRSWGHILTCAFRKLNPVNFDIHTKGKSVQPSCPEIRGDAEQLSEMLSRTVEGQWDDIHKDCKEPVMVCDQPVKSVKGVPRAQKKHDKISNGDLWYKFTPGVDEILFRYSQMVTALTTSSTEISRVFQLTTSELKAQYTFQRNRLESYGHEFTSHHMTAIALANAGLISYKKGNDEVVCIWCHVHFCNFKQTLDATALHFAYSEHICDFIKHYNQLNIPLTKRKEGNPPRCYLDIGNRTQGSSNLRYSLSMQNF